MDLVIFTIGATERWLKSGVAQEALPQDGSHGKHRNTQVKAVVWQGMGVWGRLHTLLMLQTKGFGHRKEGISQKPAVESRHNTQLAEVTALPQLAAGFRAGFRSSRQE